MLKNYVVRVLTLATVCLLAAGLQSCSPGADGGRVVVEDPLNGSTSGVEDGPGEFVEGGGWRTAGGRIIYDAGGQVEIGSFEATMRGFEIPASGANKSHPLAAWETEENYNQHDEPGSLFMWRFGMGEPLKVLAASDSIGTRHEVGLKLDGPAGAINDGKPHVYRVEWASGKVDFFLDGEKVQTLEFPRMSVRYFTIGYDRSGSSYPSIDPPAIISDVKIVDFGDPMPADPKPEAEVDRYAVYEKSFEHEGSYDNPYRQVAADAILARHNGGEEKKVPLFWDGGTSWKFRFSPDAPGRWTWRIESGDSGLNGQSGVFSCVHSKLRGAVVANHSPKRSIWQNGEGYWLFGDTQWAAFDTNPEEELNAESMRRYVEARAGQGFNFLQTALLAGAENEGGPAFADYAKEDLNPGYWAEVDRRVAHMNEQGMLAMLTLAWGGESKTAPGFKTWLDFPDDEARKRFVRYVVGRYSAYNVGFSMAGEWDLAAAGDGAEERTRMLGSLAAESDPHERLITVLPASGSSRGLSPFHEEPWLSFAGYRYEFGNLHQTALEHYERTNPLAYAGYGVYLLDGEGGRSLDEMRHATWDVTMAGYNVVTAFASTYMGGANHPGPFGVDDPKNEPWIEQIQHVRELFMELAPKDNMRGGWRWVQPFGDNWGEKFRGDELISCDRNRDAASSGERPPRVAHWGRGKPGFGHTGVIYVRGHRGPHTWTPIEDVNEPEDFAPEHIHRVYRFNPRTGEYKEMGDHKGPSAAPFTVPDDRDWVFVVRRMNLYPYEF